MKYVSIDIETTGLNFETDQILSIGLVIDDLSKPLINESELPKYEIIFDYTEQRLNGNIYAINMNSDLFERIIKLKEFQKSMKVNNPINPLIKPKPNHSIYFIEPNLKLVIHNKIVEILDQHFDIKQAINVAGKNVSGFDLPFLQYNYNLDETLRFRHRTLDPSILFAKKDNNQLPDLGECKKRAGFINTDVAHKSLDDALDVVKLLHYKFDHT